MLVQKQEMPDEFSNVWEARYDKMQMEPHVWYWHKAHSDPFGTEIKLDKKVAKKSL